MATTGQRKVKMHTRSTSTRKIPKENEQTQLNLENKHVLDFTLDNTTKLKRIMKRPLQRQIREEMEKITKFNRNLEFHSSLGKIN